MSRRSGETPSQVAAEWAHARPRPDPPATSLILGDPAPHLARALHDCGHTVTRWSRHLTRGQRCAPWPPAGPFGEVWVRMPRSSLEAAMLLHAAAARIDDGAQLHLYGAGDEGIRSAGRHFPPGTAPTRPVLIKRRCRVLAAKRTAAPAREDALDRWQIRTPVDWGAGKRQWTFFPGMFASGRIDPATALLIEHLPTVPAGARVLDFGAGSGVIAAAVLARTPGARVVLLERDAIALVAAARNVPGGTLVLGSGLGHVEGRFDLIVSNPPIHAGSAQSLTTVEALIREAPGALAPGGAMVLVAQRRLPIPRLLGASFRGVRTVADQGPHRVWAADGPWC